MRALHCITLLLATTGLAISAQAQTLSSAPYQTPGVLARRNREPKGGKYRNGAANK